MDESDGTNGTNLPPDNLILEQSQQAKRDALYGYSRSIFHKPDEDGCDIILSSCRSHYFSGNKPVWLWVVGLSGSGKTELGIRITEGLEDTHPLSEITGKAFVTAKKGQKGLLDRLPLMFPGISGDKRRHGLLIFKDFTTFLSMRPDDRALIAGQLREIADGYWGRATGESSEKRWEGKVSIIAACTFELEHAWATLRKMGDRFVTMRWHDGDDTGCCEMSQAQEGHEEEIAATLKSLARKYFGTPTFAPPPRLPDSFQDPIIQMCRLSCWLREPVHRNMYNHQIDDVGPREKATRLNKAVRTIMAGYSILRGRNLAPGDLKIAYRVAMDSAPVRKRQIIDSMGDGVELNVSEVSEISGIPRTSVIREIQELEALEIVRLSKFEDEGDKRTLAILTDKFSELREKALSLIFQPKRGDVH